MSAVAPLNIVTPLTLEGAVVRLEPVRREHSALFWAAVKDSLEIFQWMPYSLRTPEDFELFVSRILEEEKRGESVPFATVERSSGRVIGSTRFMNIDRG